MAWWEIAILVVVGGGGLAGFGYVAFDTIRTYEDTTQLRVERAAAEAELVRARHETEKAEGRVWLAEHRAEMEER